ncbi:hypothetical protein HYY69_05020 [Candidatus Woesearchaeota archaeon]|nr:hypothetical protein [Candidatus Woesearchaeota archaeon]
MTEQTPEQQFSPHAELQDLIAQAVASVEAGTPNDDLVKMIKSTPTCILLPSPDHPEIRYRPGSTLVTYMVLIKMENQFKKHGAVVLLLLVKTRSF